MQHLTVKELQRRYRAGERNFVGVDLSGESLRGMNLKGIDLSGADLSRTDIRGTDFTKATLISTQFVAAKAGTQRRWLVPKLLIAFVLTTLSSFIVGAFWGIFALSILIPFFTDRGRFIEDVLFGILGLVLFSGFLGLTYIKGILATLGIALGAIALAAAVAFVDAGTFSVVAMSAITLAGIVTFATAGAAAYAVVVAGAEIVTFAITFIFGFAVSVSIAAQVALGKPVAMGIGTIGIVITLVVNLLISRRALEGDSRDALVRSLAIWLGSWGGTKFVGANLTDAAFSEANLKSTHLYKSDLTRTNFHLAKSVNLARLGQTALANFDVQNLLISLRGSRRSYVGLNLKGAYLVGADVADADFTEADLSQATLAGATLERAVLTKTQALGTCFRQTILSGATLEAWNIDSTTQLDGAICDYVYLLRNQQERRPSSGSFAPGDFTKLFQEVLDTIDLIFQNGVDWKAFVRTFNDVQEQYDNADLGVQAIENKGDGVVVVKLHAAPDADKPAIHQSFTEIYQLALQEAEARYKAQLDAKDDQIADYRQQSANMQEVVKLLAQRPINVDVKATAESKAMQGNDNSQKYQCGRQCHGQRLSDWGWQHSLHQISAGDVAAA
ncbi:MAG: pentapeptide repeat-containing protein [Kaiparowitsia implicata GSE-PSE-MK54-09C]|jgi:uncharacterized protein YjbI with pentapeptide repeats|nr:pentapeptide repeat-containing protein [Kaiparowitsia implicata GSE-PSE-MK54-09C]